MSDVRRLDSAGAADLVALVEVFDELQVVLQCCERLVADLAADAESDPIVLEAVWTTALLCYARCFASDSRAPVLTEQDLTGIHPEGDVLGWHHALLSLRDHYAHRTDNPRERVSVGVALANGAAGGVAITASRQPQFDDVIVRQTGAIAFGLSGLVNDRIEALQKQVFSDVRDTPAAELEKLVAIDVADELP